jgi:DNA-binding transcriptional regulator GbsR (MarR family)
MTRMTRTYAAIRLLDHGPLTLAEFRAITGWGHRVCDSALRRLQAYGQVEVQNIDGRRHFARAGHAC